MAKVFLICGKICAGKTYYAERLIRRENAVLLSADELMLELEPPKDYDALAARIILFLYKKAAEIAACGTNVVLDFGFWRRSDREGANAFFAGKGIPVEWHYIDVSDSDWQTNIQRRNRAVEKGQTRAYFVDAGLLEKLEGRFEIPSPSDMDVWHINHPEEEVSP